jgi:CheY-like chemotaxis protein
MNKESKTSRTQKDANYSSPIGPLGRPADEQIGSASAGEPRVQGRSGEYPRLTCPDVGPRILVVDDDEDARDLLCGSLRNERFQVVSAANGREAMDHLLSSKPLPALILLDLNMPIMDGFTFRDEQLAAADALARIPVVVMSALPPGDCTSLGVKAVLKKPLSFPVLLEVIRRTHFESNPAT